MQKYSASQVSKQSNHFLLNILMIAIVIISNFGGMVSSAKAEAPVMEIRESSSVNKNRNENRKGGLLKNTSQNRGDFALPLAESNEIILDANLDSPAPIPVPAIRGIGIGLATYFSWIHDEIHLNSK